MGKTIHILKNLVTEEKNQGTLGNKHRVEYDECWRS